MGGRVWLSGRRRREVDVPEVGAGVDEFESGGFTSGIKADYAAFQILLGLKIGQQDVLLGKDVRPDGDQRPIGGHVNRFGSFGKGFSFQRAVEEYGRIQADAMGSPLVEVATARRCRNGRLRIRKRPAEKTPPGFAGRFSVWNLWHGMQKCCTYGLLNV